MKSVHVSSSGGDDSQNMKLCRGLNAVYPVTGAVSSAKQIFCFASVICFPESFFFFLFVLSLSLGPT